MFCPHCGNQINDNAVFCPKCGQRVGNGTDSAPVTDSNSVTSDAAKTIETPSTASPSTTGKSKEKKGLPKGLKIALISVAAVVVLFIIIGIAGSGGSSGSTPAATPATQPATPAPSETKPAATTSEPSANVTKDTTSDASLEEFIALLDETEKYVDEYEQGIDDRETPGTTEEDVKGFREYKERFENMSGIDANIYNAGSIYYGMLDDFFYNDYEASTFKSDMTSFIHELYDRGKGAYSGEELFNNEKEYADKLNALLDEMNCPSFMQTEYDQIKELLNNWYYASAMAATALDNDDPVMHKAAMDLSGHLFEGIVACKVRINAAVQNGIQVNWWGKLNSARDLYSEIKEAAAMDSNTRASYVFKTETDGVVNYAYTPVETIYPSLYNSYNNFIIVTLGCLTGEREVIVECEIPGLTQKYSQAYKVTPYTSSLYIKPAALTGSIDLTKAKDAQINISITDKKDGSIIDKQSFPVHIKSQNDVEWFNDEFGSSTKDNILCFLEPESEKITELKRKAVDILSDITDGQVNAIIGYQSPFYDNEYVSTYLQAAGLMMAMSDMGVVYTMDDFSIDGSQQHVLLPEQVLTQRTGLCVETSLVIASALQSAGFNTYLIFPPGHAQVAVETWDGSGEYFLIETTALPNDKQVFADYANMILKDNKLSSDSSFPIYYMDWHGWSDYIYEKTDDGVKAKTYVIDCSEGSMLGLTPFAN